MVVSCVLLILVLIVAHLLNFGWLFVQIHIALEICMWWVDYHGLEAHVAFMVRVLDYLLVEYHAWLGNLAGLLGHVLQDIDDWHGQHLQSLIHRNFLELLNWRLNCLQSVGLGYFQSICHQAGLRCRHELLHDGGRGGALNPAWRSDISDNLFDGD